VGRAGRHEHGMDVFFYQRVIEQAVFPRRSRPKAEDFCVVFFDEKRG
jgi:hypothetical protein